MRKLMQIRRKSSDVGSRHCLYLALPCHFSYCCCRALPIVSSFFCLLLGPTGSYQHSRLAQGTGLITSGGSVPKLRQRTKATPAVFILSFKRHVAAYSIFSIGPKNSSVCHGSVRKIFSSSHTMSLSRVLSLTLRTSPSSIYSVRLPAPTTRI